MSRDQGTCMVSNGLRRSRMAATQVVDSDCCRPHWHVLRLPFTALRSTVDTLCR
jgi:hypothetical protein